MRTLSAESSNPFVTHDKEVDIVRFAINSGFADIVLDGQVALRVMYQRPGETEVRAQTLTYYDTDGLHNYYDWQLLSADLAKKGTLTVALCILRADNEVEEWHTTPYQIRVLDTIHTDDSDEGDETITPTVAQRVAILESMIQRVASGAPIVVSSMSAMTDTDKIYVLSTDGNWYYHNGSAWVAGGEYGAVATDTTLTQAGMAADAEAVGNAIHSVNNVLDLHSDALGEKYSLTPYTDLIGVGNGYISAQGNLVTASGYKSYAFTATKAGKMYVSGTASNHQCFVCKCKNAVYSEGTWTSATVEERLSKSAGTLPTAENPMSYTTGDTIAVSMTGLSTNIYIGGIYVTADRIEALEESVYEIVPSQCTFFDHKNLINPSDINSLVRYSPASTSLIADTSGNYASTGMIEVNEGVTYCYSGTAATYTGGYFGEDAECAAGQSAIDNITWTVSVDESGRYFTVPEGIGIKYVCINMIASSGIATGTYQLEIGEVGTEIVAYDEAMKINAKYLPVSGGGGGSLEGLDALEPVSYGDYDRTKISNFIRHWKRRDKDIVVVGTGTSLSARGVGYCETLPNANARPPLMDSKNLASRIWDKIAWDHQYYRRYDYTGFFAETGTWRTAVDLAVNGVKQWDDGAYRNGLTRYAEGEVSVSYTLPANAWATNFIYRTDESGSESCTITVAEGDGKMEVWNGSAWVEANGYVFSEKQTIQTLSNVSVPDPTKDDNAPTTYATYQIGGNTVYQKRLKMRCIDRTTTKTITISSASGRMMYWGVEWSEREFMIIYINSARGSHNITHNSATALHKTQESDIWIHKPDLIFTENPIHNSGASGYTHNYIGYPSSYWYNITHNFFFNADSPVSLISRATANGITGLEWVVYDTTLTPNFQGINSDGTLVIAPDKNGKMTTALDAMQMSQDYFADHTDVVSINAVKYWIDAAVALFGDLYTATQAGGVDGATFTFEGSHWNTTGAAVMFKAIGGIFDFY